MNTFIGIQKTLEGLDMWVITERPSDFPDSYVVRHSRAAFDGLYCDAVPLAVVATAEEARAHVPLGKVLVETRESARVEADRINAAAPAGAVAVVPDPVVFEVWV